MATRARAWQGDPLVAPVLADIAAFGDGRPLHRAPALAALFASGSEAARHLVSRFVAAMTAGLDANPLGHVPARHSHDAGRSSLMLARKGRITLTVVAQGDSPSAPHLAPKTVDFTPADVWEVVLAGKAAARLVTAEAQTDASARLVTRDIALRPGAMVHRDAASRALVLDEIEGSLVTLRLQRRRKEPTPAREYRLDDGQMIHRAAGNPDDSRIEMLMAVAGAMGRADAAPHLAAIACSGGSEALRWQALRQCLALDTAAGFATLTAMARDGGDPLSEMAGSLRAQLVEAHPLLADLPCPA